MLTKLSLLKWKPKYVIPCLPAVTVPHHIQDSSALACQRYLGYVSSFSYLISKSVWILLLRLLAHKNRIFYCLKIGAVPCLRWFSYAKMVSSFSSWWRSTELAKSTQQSCEASTESSPQKKLAIISSVLLGLITIFIIIVIVLSWKCKCIFLF